MLHQSNMETLFLDFVVESCRAVWFNSANFPKTEVGSGKSGAPVQTLENLEMKKTLVAIAALAAFGAQAQSSVTIDGGVDAGYQAIDYKGNKVNGIAGNGSSTSQINFRGVSDVGGGIKADFRVETDWNMGFNRANSGAANVDANGTNAAAGTFGNGEIRAGIGGNFGRVDMGVVNFNGLTTYLTGQPFSTAIGGGYGSIARVNQDGSLVRSDNSFKYTSPTMAGLNVTVYQANKQTKGANATDNFSSTLGRSDLAGSKEFGVNYANGPIAASYSTLKQDNVGVTASTTAGTTVNTLNTLGANYTMGAAKFFLLNQTNKTDTNSVNTAYTTVSATYTMGNYVFMAQTGSLKNKLTDKKSNITGLGVDYNLSKTTALYVRSESIKDDAAVVAITGFTAATGNVTRTRTAAGLRVAF
nr:porin [uncultured Limnohabitans sp.]